MKYTAMLIRDLYARSIVARRQVTREEYRAIVRILKSRKAVPMPQR